ncbi:MAG: AMP-binding protein, partial [Psychrosphaera sp.]|nr:AMP-binding protein [Psychrosphaera sp.]
TLFMTLLSGFNILLWRYTQQTDLLVGTPIANRNKSELEGLIGFFVNTLVLRTQIDPDDTVASLLGKVKTTTLNAYERQILPFDRIVNHLNPVRSLSHNPIFQVMFVMQNTQMDQVDLPGLTSKLSHTDNQSAKFDLTLELTEEPGALYGRLEYATALFAPETIERIIGHYQTLLEGMVTSAHLPLGQLPLLSRDEQHYLLYTLNETQVDFPQNLGIHQVFEQQAEQSPDHIALFFNEEQMTYRQLNEKANALAGELRTQGVKPDTLVGLCVERSFEMMVAMLAILKAGGAYLPLDLSYPLERLNYMLEDANVKYLVTQENALAVLSVNPKITTIWLENHAQWADYCQLDADLNKAGSAQVTATNLAYMIYTSGSSGKPKGVMIEHQSVLNFFVGLEQQLGTSTEQETWLALSSISFDISVLELLWTLSRGHKIVL